ncbi:hypothetical protein [Demequina capsici]|uniref:DUF4328 domain-containing protein n=1 Tax=Demequina capsici TaxID=3075620 RepID=A0AA96F5I3_9MICO|nr:hypothetical protein [Demequina sp. OYTSA14]WNM24213.1 hypothetical protein RN606_12730 [Demequina sp. OYTSA14]
MIEGDPQRATFDAAIAELDERSRRRDVSFATWKARNALWSTGVHAAAWTTFNVAYAVTGEPPSTASGGMLGIVMVLTGFASWMLLSEWMCGIAYVRRSQGLTMPSNAWIYFSWWIPVAELFSPARTMRRLGQGAVSTWLLLAWWLPWLLATGLVTARDSAADPTQPALVAATAIVVSWLALQRIIRRVSTAVA